MTGGDEDEDIDAWGNTLRSEFAKELGVVSTHCYTVQHTATHCNTLQHTATYCNTLQHTATHCYALQHTAIHTYSNTICHRVRYCLNTL